MSDYNVVQTYFSNGTTSGQYVTVSLPQIPNVNNTLYALMMWTPGKVGFSQDFVYVASGGPSGQTTFNAGFGSATPILYSRKVIAGDTATFNVLSNNINGLYELQIWEVANLDLAGVITEYTQMFYFKTNNGVYTNMEAIEVEPTKVGSDGNYLALGYNGGNYLNVSNTVDNPETKNYFGGNGNNLVIIFYPVYNGLLPKPPMQPSNYYNLQSVVVSWNADNSFNQFKTVLTGGYLASNISQVIKGIAGQQKLGTSLLVNPSTNLNDRYVQGLDAKI